MSRPEDARLVASARSEPTDDAPAPGPEPADPARPAVTPASAEPAEVSDDIVTPARGDVPPETAPVDAATLRARWHEIQSGFVDDPRAAVTSADELVRQALQNAALRDATDTEALRQALRGYRTVLENLLDA